jgi:tRNA-specific 2-thiouridylase
MKETRVFVGLSGGVDSSVAAKRLIEKGYEVVGVFIKVWQPDFIYCDWEKERLDAMRVAAHLGIPFLTMNAEDVYKREVADYMIRSYEAGITPNPDVMCNEHVKFGAFYEWARAYGASYIATGHYAQVRTHNNKTELHRGIDPKKDQSYFLWRIHQATLENILLPVGDTVKAEIRREAESARIPTAQKSDSQGICFLGHIDMYEFLKHYIQLTPGNVLDEQGTVIGEHKGAQIYTNGQRHGFTITRSDTQSPHYVTSRNLDKNTITVSTEHVMRTCSEIQLVNMNELGTGFTEHMEAEFRYHGSPVQVTYAPHGNENAILIPTETSQEFPTQGQSCVLYRGTECCGGGIIS